jgi:hypothetical protein
MKWVGAAPLPISSAKKKPLDNKYVEQMYSNLPQFLLLYVNEQDSLLSGRDAGRAA